jgi:glycosyltransferase involved in cell wall biosynthesis
MGSIVEYKGFHLLAKAWKKVLEKMPDAHLNVIGTGALYDNTVKLGKWGLAEESYENSFMPYLTDNNGDILPSVTFWGKLGATKYEILKCTKVGVPNPSGVSETFCKTAIEFQSMGALVTTIKYVGFLDTVYSSGLLYSDINLLADSIVALLSKKENDYENCMNFIEQNFSYEKVCEKWIQLFDDLKHKRAVKVSAQLKNRDYNQKWLTELNRKIKLIIPFGKYLPTMMFYRSCWNRLQMIKEKMP